MKKISDNKIAFNKLRSIYVPHNYYAINLSPKLYILKRSKIEIVYGLIKGSPINYIRVELVTL